jgi:hypothetical protein
MPDSNGKQLRNLSRHQYGTLKFIHNHNVTLKYLRRCHANTLGSLAYQGWIRRSGTGDDALIFLTNEGETELLSYERGGMNERRVEGELTDRVRRLLRLTRSANVMSIGGAA